MGAVEKLELGLNKQLDFKPLVAELCTDEPMSPGLVEMNPHCPIFSSTRGDWCGDGTIVKTRAAMKLFDTNT